MKYEDQIFNELDNAYKKYRKMFPDKPAFTCWANMCINEYLDGEVVYTTIRDSWEEYMKFKSIKLGRKKFKKRKKR